MRRSLLMILLAALTGAGLWLMPTSRAFSAAATTGSSSQPGGNTIYIHTQNGPLFMFRPSPDEEKKIKGILEGIHQKELLLSLEEQKRKIELAEILLQNSPSRRALNRKLGEILNIEREKQENLVDAYFNIKKDLKPEEQQPFTMMIIHRVIGDSPGPEMHPGPEIRQGQGVP